MTTLLIEGVSASETEMYEGFLVLSPSDTFMITTQDGYDAGLLPLKISVVCQTRHAA
jgi:hypothetical protein